MGDVVLASSEKDIAEVTVVSREAVVISAVNGVFEEACDIGDVKIPADRVVICGVASTVEYIAVVSSSEDMLVDSCRKMVVFLDISSVVVTGCEVDVTENSEEARGNGDISSSVVTSAPDVSRKRVDMSPRVVTFAGILDVGVAVVVSLVDIPVDKMVISAVGDNVESNLRVGIASECVVSAVTSDEILDVEVAAMTSVVGNSFSLDGVVPSGEISAVEDVVVGTS